MLMNDVNLWFAKDSKDNIILIEEVDKDNKDKYFCPICGSEVIARQGTEKSWSFAHEDKSKCNGETRIHWWIKNKLIEKGTRFMVKTDKEQDYICEEILIEQSYEVNGNTYKPDLTVVTECGETIFFEIDHTNKKKPDDYMSAWVELNKIIVEVSTKDLINNNSNALPIFKAIFFDGKSTNVKKSNLYYNTIGKYKERLLTEGEYNKRKEEIKKLDWLWKMLSSYKKDDVDFDMLIDIIDNVGKEELDIIKEILKKQRCSDILKEYSKLKKAMVKDCVRALTQEYSYVNKDNLIIQDTPNDVIYVDYSKKDEIDTREYFYIFGEPINKLTNEIHEFLYMINNFIGYKKTLKPICECIKNIYQDKNNMFINVVNNNSRYIKHLSCRDFIYEIEVEGFIDREILKFKLDFDEIKYYRYKKWNGKNLVKASLDYNLNNINTEEVIFFIKKYIEEKCNSDEKLINEQKEVILKGNSDINEKINQKLNKIIDILNSNTEKIGDFEVSYFMDSKLINGVYFKDYKNKEFIVYDSSMCNININIESLLFENHANCMNINYIDVYWLREENNIYMIESEDSYYITNKPKGKYIFIEYFKNKKINLSFKKVNENYKKLARYNFVEATKQIIQIYKDVCILEEEYFDNYEVAKIIDNKNFTDNNINKKLKNILYPIIYMLENSNENDLYIVLNVEFTKDGINNKFRPWIIKDFIEALRLIKIKNAYNIIN